MKKALKLLAFGCMSLLVLGTIATLALAFDLYSIFSPTNPEFVRFMLFLRQRRIPSPNPLFQMQIKPQTLQFLSDGHKLKGWFFKNPHSNSVCLFSQGKGQNAAFYSFWIRNLLACGHSVFIYDYSGYGSSEGEPSTTQMVDDGIAAYDYLNKSRGYGPQFIIGYGTSLGSAVTAQIMMHRQFSKVVLESTFTSLREVAVSNWPVFNLYPAELFTPLGLNTALALEQAHPPVLIINGAQDTLVPVRLARKLFDCAQGPKRLVILQRSGHCMNFGPEQNQYIAELRRFL